MKYMDDKVDKEVGYSGGSGGGGRGVSDSVVEKNFFRVLRSGSNSISNKDGYTDDVNVKIKSAASSPNRDSVGRLGSPNGNGQTSAAEKCRTPTI